MFIVKNKKIFFSITAFLLAGSITAIAVFGLNPGIDFAGGSLLEVEYEQNRPASEHIQDTLEELGVSGASVQNVDTLGLIIKTPSLTDNTYTEVRNAIAYNNEFPYSEKRFKSIGPAISNELKNKSIFALILVVLVIVVFVAHVFRHVSLPVSSWKYGMVAIVALVHDLVVPTGIFAILGSVFLDYQIDVLFITALLAILGFSVNDTIVVFDRIRENLRKATEKKQSLSKEAFENIVGNSLQQTFKRSLYTSITTLITLSFLYFVGGESTKPFALVLALGVIAGTYSSLFIASPLLVWLEQTQKEPIKKVEVVKKNSEKDDFKDIMRQADELAKEIARNK